MILVYIPFLFAAFIGLVMECYKKKIRKDMAGAKENIAVAAVLSTAFGFLFYRIGINSELFASMNGTPLLIIPSAILIYLMQRPVCMSFWKPLLKKWMEKKLG